MNTHDSIVPSLLYCEYSRQYTTLESTPYLETFYFIRWTPRYRFKYIIRTHQAFEKSHEFKERREYFIGVIPSISAEHSGPSNVGKGTKPPLPKSEPYCCGSFHISLPCHIYTGTCLLRYRVTLIPTLIFYTITNLGTFLHQLNTRNPSIILVAKRLLGRWKYRGRY